MKPWTKAAVQGAACGLMLGLVLLISGRLWQPQVAVAQAKQAAVPDVVKARRFEVVDAAGKVRASLFVNPHGASGLDLSDAAGKTRVSLMVGVFNVVDATGKRWSSTVSTLLLLDATGNREALLSVSPDGTPSLDLFDAARKTRASLTIIPDGIPSLLFYKDGKVIWKAP